MATTLRDGSEAPMSDQPHPTHSDLTLSDGSTVRGTPDALARVAKIDRDMQTQWGGSTNSLSLGGS